MAKHPWAGARHRRTWHIETWRYGWALFAATSLILASLAERS